MKAKSNDPRDFKGEPPCDGREWKSLPDVAAKLGIKPNSVWSYTRRWQWTIYKQNKRRTWILKSDVDSYLEFRRMKKRWYERHRPQHWRMEIGIIEDEAMLKRLFLTTTQAALMMEVVTATIIR